MSVMIHESVNFCRVAQSVLMMADHRDDCYIFYSLLPEETHWKERNAITANRDKCRQISEQFAGDLHRSNVSAFNVQYRESEPIEEIKACGMPYTKMQLCKFLHSVRYNMITNDGEEHNFRGAFKRLERFLAALHESIITALPEYNEADWCGRTSDAHSVVALTDMMPSPASVPAAAPSKPQLESIDRDQAIKRIREGLKKRSGKAWSVTGGKGTAWGWINISSPPRRCTWGYRLKEGAITRNPEDYEGYDTGKPDGYMTPGDCAELGKLLGLDRPCHQQGQSIAASNDYYREYVSRAEGRTPEVIGEPYWD